MTDPDLVTRALKAAAAARKRGRQRGDVNLLVAGLRVERAAGDVLKALAGAEHPGPTAAMVVKAVEEDRFLLCVAYSPNKMPRRGADKRIDVVSPEVLEKAAWRFAENGFKVGVGHKPGGENAARVVESWVHRGPSWHLIGPDGAESVVQEGDWVVGLILSPPAWADYKAGKFGGVSMQGSAGRKPATKQTLARVKAS